MSSRADGAVLSYLGLRRAVGVIGILLPFVLVGGDLALGGDGLRDSISRYYYSPMRDVFVGSLCAVGVFLYCYRYDRPDNRLANVTGTAAIAVALLPTRPDGATTTAATVVGYLHLAAATVFFAGLAWFCLALFTRGESGTPGKAARNVVYRVCGATIVACLVLAALDAALVPDAVAERFHTLFWLEAVAILAFGVAWFVKGDTLLRDQRTEDPAPVI
ncbi:DUF998 domain-containing protein [Pseudonocardia sp. EV170527-09]|uniref:DUF998 domain-containing protein n=1 Tax=Pseudonocardia sp. EV170527-09 TaxID=2603411 RepID=UPI0011F254D2|nr:DUF998 domain-containing protein [Pseudonocardia sp. EV170527-09]KAA1031068.1 DUF998 domain-containing protein [Pseudonocardia sp. EV170527-09]